MLAGLDLVTLHLTQSNQQQLLSKYFLLLTLVSLIVDHMLIFFFVNFSLPICLIKDYAYITCDKFLTLCFYCDYYAYIEI